MIDCCTMALMLATLAHDMSQLQGRWETVPASDIGHNRLAAELVFEGRDGKLRVELARDWIWNDLCFSYVLHPWQHPKAIDLTVYDPKERTYRHTILGIYRLSGDALILDYCHFARPTEFGFTSHLRLKRQN